VKDFDHFSFRRVGFSGTVPNEIKVLTELLVFVAYERSLAGPITTCFEGLTKLQIVSLEDSRLTGTLSRTIGTENPDLVTVELGGNLIRGPIPASLSALDSLEKLHLGLNLLSGSIPSELGLVPRLSKYGICNAYLPTAFFWMLTNIIGLVLQ
jgi:hypothetical protein